MSATRRLEAGRASLGLPTDDKRRSPGLRREEDVAVQELDAVVAALERSQLVQSATWSAETTA